MKKKKPILYLSQLKWSLIMVKKVKNEFDAVRKSAKGVVAPNKKFQFVVLYLWFSIVLILAKLELKLLQIVGRKQLVWTYEVINASLLRLRRLLRELLYRARKLLGWTEVDEEEEEEEEEE